MAWTGAWIGAWSRAWIIEGTGFGNRTTEYPGEVPEGPADRDGFRPFLLWFCCSFSPAAG